MENAGYKKPEVKNFTGFSDEELTLLYWRLNVGVDLFKKADINPLYNEDYISCYEMWRSINTELDRRKVNPTEVMSNKNIFTLPDGNKAEILNTGCVKVGCLTISRQTINEINEASEEAYLKS